MQVECLIIRPGVTPVFLPPKTEYRFMPIPGSKKGEPTTSVCDIDNEVHLDWLLGRGKYKRQQGQVTQFREYDPEQAWQDLSTRRKTAVSTTGFVVVLFSKDKGYIVVDKRGKEKDDKGRAVVLYAGTEGVWMKKREETTPFMHEIDAYTWMKEEAEMQFADAGGNDEDDDQDTGKAYQCQDCGLPFRNPVELSEHWQQEHKKKTVDRMAKAREAKKNKAAQAEM